MAKYIVELDGATEEVSTLKEVAAVLGVSRVSGKEIENGDYPQVTLIEDMEEEVIKEVEEEVVEDPQKFLDEHIEIVVVGDAPTGEVEEEEVEDDVYPDDADSLIEYPEEGDFTDIKDLKKYIKGLTNEELTEWCELEGVEYKPNDHVAINRMRQAMAINALHFPDTVRKGKGRKKSKYADYSTEELVQMALDNDVAVRDAKGDERIERMYTIMALREAGLIG